MKATEVDRIRDSEFLLFKTAVQKFYQRRENKYFKSIRLKYGNDSTATTTTFKKEAEEYLGTLPGELSGFISDYVNDRLDQLVDNVRLNKIIKAEAEISMEVLKYILEAGESHVSKQKGLK